MRVSMPNAGSTELAEKSVRQALPVVANGKRLIVFLVLLVLVGAIAFIGGSFVRAPQQSALDVAGYKLEVAYQVEERVVSPGVELPGRVVAGAAEPVIAVSSGEARMVVTRLALRVGDVVALGDLLGEVSGRPLIAMSKGVPLYRDLVDGSKGADVVLLQEALVEMGLEASVTGEVGPRTLAAVAGLYDRLDATMISPGVISWSEFFSIPSKAIVETVTPVGTVLSGELPLATIKITPDLIVARADVLEADELEPGQSVQVRTAGLEAESSVLRLGEFSVAEDGSGAGRDVFIEIPTGFDVGESEPVTIASGTAQPPGPAIPVIALRQDSSGIYVELRPADESSAPSAEGKLPASKVYVTVTAQSDGWAAIEPHELLKIGTEVSVAR